MNPRRLSFGYDVAPRRDELAARLPAAVDGGRIAELVASAPTALAQHPRLVEHLAHYRALAADPSVGPVRVSGTIRPGDPCPGADGLARWLAALGDLRPGPAAAPERYEGALVDAVRRFQERHGLEPDGVIGPATAAALAVPAEQRVRQIELALERVRWIPPLPAGRALFVNIPAFELFALDTSEADAEPALRMRVVVGKAGTRTPVFTGSLQTVVFAPYWNVPRSITVHEELPKLRRNPGSLAARGLEIVSEGRVLPPGSASLDELAAGRARLRQRPGARNALGRVKFLFPNSHSVYLHDTPSRQLFERSRRAFSHGCIRVEKPTELAAWALAGDPEWSPERMRAAMAGPRETRVRVEPPVPVVILYATAMARRDGTIAFYEDLYRHDGALERALATRGAD